MKNILTLLALLALAVLAPAQTSAVKTVSVYSNAGAPASGTTEIATITIGGTPTAGSFTLTQAGGRTTAAITWSATDATLIARIDAALEALPGIGTGGCVVTAGTGSSGIGTYLVTYSGVNAKKDMPALTGTSSLTGSSPTLAVATTTAGVAATFPNAPSGTLVEDSTNGALYINTSTTANSPTWTAIVSLATSTSAGIGYATGAGGAVTQTTSRATGVTLSKISGQITTDTTSLAAAAEVTFTVTNTLVAATDTVIVNITPGGTGTPVAYVSAVASGSFNVTISNLHASTADTSADVINFAVIKAVAN